jgi:hypothetical protein
MNFCSRCRARCRLSTTACPRCLTRCPTRRRWRSRWKSTWWAFYQSWTKFLSFNCGQNCTLEAAENNCITYLDNEDKIWVLVVLKSLIFHVDLFHPYKVLTWNFLEPMLWSLKDLRRNNCWKNWQFWLTLITYTFYILGIRIVALVFEKNAQILLKIRRNQCSYHMIHM